MSEPKSLYNHPKRKKRMKRPEQLLQIGIMNFAKRVMELEKYKNFLIYHTPNGGGRSKAEAGIMKGMGVMSGVADLTVLIPPNDNHDYPKCIFIEVKATTGGLDPAQEDFESRVMALGFDYYVISAADQADALDQWIKIMARNGVRF